LAEAVPLRAGGTHSFSPEELVVYPRLIRRIRTGSLYHGRGSQTGPAPSASRRR